MSLNNISRLINGWVADNFGSRRGALLTYQYRALYILGRYRKYRRIDWSKVERLVFICKGNICRSAYAEAVAKSTGIESISCGIDTVFDAPANEEAIKVGAKRGFDLSKHKTTPLQSLNFNKSDLLIAMEPWQAEYIHRNLKNCNVPTLLGLWGRPVSPHIHDPYGLTSAFFDNCFNYIENNVNEIASRISKN